MKALVRVVFAMAIGTFVIFSGGGVSAAEQTITAPPTDSLAVASPAVQHDVSRPLREIPAIEETKVHHQVPVHRLRSVASVGTASDVARQTSTSGPQVGVTSGLNFAGIGNGDYGFAPNSTPPDTNGAVGATQYVQWVNTSLAVFDKATGSIVPGFPKSGNSLWSGFGGGCELNNDGDPIAQYDKAAQRWVLTQFSVSTTPYLQCVAVSTTSDATGTYNRYAFSYGNVEFPDYPKLGVWPDAYYISFNIFNSGVSFAGTKACAYDRAKLLAGAAATQVCFQLSPSFGGVLPSDLDGATAPPAGSPNYFVYENGSNSLGLWKFHVDFATPANSTFVGPTNIPVVPFSEACSITGNCIPQPNTSQQLDSLGDRLMYRLAYRNFGDHEALVVNHSISAGSSVGVRWYEIRNPAGSPTVFQQGTYAPDSNYRWMGSIAMDKVGDVGLGYSVSSSSVFPSISFTGRVPSDPLGTLQAENSIIAGTGSQLPFVCGGGQCGQRWGDYSAMTIDPGDDCSFWYTTEYLKASGDFNWSTRIASFKFPGCAGGTQLPTVTGVNPNQGPTSGGTSVTLTGTNFTGATNVSFGGTPATSFTVNSPTSIAAVSPAHSAGTVHITVTTPGGTSTTSPADQFTYLAPAPTVTGINPNQGPTSGGTSVAITGTNLTGTTSVKFGSVAASSFTVNSATSITAVSPPQAAGTVDVTVATPDGTSATSPADRFTYVAAAPAVSLNPTSLSFGNQAVGSTSPEQIITVTNTGNASLNITLVDLVGANSADYGIGLETCTGASLAPNGNCTVPISFSPNQPGASSASLRITDNAPGSPHTAPLSGTGVGPAVTLTPASLTFADQPVRTTGAPQTLTVRNTGNAPLHVTGVRLDGAPPNDFTINSESCTQAPIPVNGTCSISVSSSPTAAGPTSDAVDIDDDAFDSPQSAPLTGNGI